MMNFKITSIGFILTVLLFSCRNGENKSDTENSEIENTEAAREAETEVSALEKEAIIENLQGKWKAPEYPFDVVQFKDTLVKFIEEGVVEAPRFREFRISGECPFEVNNIKNTTPDEVILVVVGAETCEKLQISSDTLSLSGFSAHTGEDYRRIFIKEN